MAIPMMKQDYRPTAEDLVDAAITDARFVGYLLELLPALIDGTPTERHSALIAFGTLAKKRAGDLEQSLIEQHFDQKDY